MSFVHEKNTSKKCRTEVKKKNAFQNNEHAAYFVEYYTVFFLTTREFTEY